MCERQRRRCGKLRHRERNDQRMRDRGGWLAGDRWSLEVSSGALVANDAVSDDGGTADLAAEGDPRATTLCVVADRLAQISGAILVTGGGGELPFVVASIGSGESGNLFSDSRAVWRGRGGGYECRERTELCGATGARGFSERVGDRSYGGLVFLVAAVAPDKVDSAEGSAACRWPRIRHAAQVGESQRDQASHGVGERSDQSRTRGNRNFSPGTVSFRGSFERAIARAAGVDPDP